MSQYTFIHRSATVLSRHICTVVPSLLVHMVWSGGLTYLRSFRVSRSSRRRSQSLSCPVCSCIFSSFSVQSSSSTHADANWLLTHPRGCRLHLRSHLVRLFGSTMMFLAFKNVLQHVRLQPRTCRKVSNTAFDFVLTNPYHSSPTYFRQFLMLLLRNGRPTSLPLFSQT